MLGQYLSETPFVLFVRFGSADGKVTKVHQHNFDDIGAAHAKLNEALGWSGVVEVELTMVLKRVRPAKKRDWKNEAEAAAAVPVERRPLPPPKHSNLNGK